MAAALDFSTPHLLRDEAEYDAAHAELLALLDADPAPGTPEHDRLEFLTVLIEAYDRERVRFGEDEPVSPQALVDFMLEQHGMTRHDLAPHLGGKSRVSEFFSGTRPLSIGQVKALRSVLHIPADLLIPADDLLEQAAHHERDAARAASVANSVRRRAAGVEAQLAQVRQASSPRHRGAKTVAGQSRVDRTAVAPAPRGTAKGAATRGGKSAAVRSVKAAAKGGAKERGGGSGKKGGVRKGAHGRPRSA